MLLTWVGQTEGSLKKMREENTPGPHQVKTTPCYILGPNSTYHGQNNPYLVVFLVGCQPTPQPESPTRLFQFFFRSTQPAKWLK